MILNLIKIIRVHLIDDCLYFSIFEQIIQVEIKIDVHKMGEKECLITTFSIIYTTIYHSN